VEQTIQKEIGECKSDIESLKESVEQTIQKISEIDAITVKITEVETQLGSLDLMVNRLGESVKKRLEDTNDLTTLLVDYGKSMLDLKGRVNQFVKKFEDMNNQNLNFTNNIKEQIDKESQTTTFHGKDIAKLKTQIRKIMDAETTTPASQFSINCKGVFYGELKKTLFFAPGLILPHKTYIHSIFITTNVKPQAKNSRKFEFSLIRNDTIETIHSFEKDQSEEVIMEEFDQPIEVPAKTKLMVSCDKKLDLGIALLTLSYRLNFNVEKTH
jgi:hypothetical protein